MKYFVILLLLLIVIMVAITPTSAQCAYDPSQPHKPCYDSSGTLITESQQVQIEIIGWDDFEYEFVGDAAIFKNNLAGLGILEAGTKYYVIQKAEFHAENFGDKDTRVNATIGYAIQPGDQMLHPPMHENATESEHEEFMIKMRKLGEMFAQQSPIKVSYDFVVDVENPFYIKFPLVLNESGQYTRQFYKNTHIFEGPSSSGMGGLVVVDKFSKALDENGECKNEKFRRIIKHDYATMVCVYPSTISKLQDSGWAIDNRAPEIDSFEKCAAAGNPVMESYPRQCRTPDGKHFVEEIG